MTEKERKDGRRAGFDYLQAQGDSVAPDNASRGANMTDKERDQHLQTLGYCLNALDSEISARAARAGLWGVRLAFLRVCDAYELATDGRFRLDALLAASIDEQRRCRETGGER